MQEWRGMDGLSGRAGNMSGVPNSRKNLEALVSEVLAATPAIDVHTHLFSPEFGPLALWGIDDLLTYHYLEAEFFRFSDTAPEEYWTFSKRKQADAIWRTLFVENT